MKVTGFWSDVVLTGGQFYLITQVEGYNITAYNEAGQRVWTHPTPQGMWYLRASALPDGTIAVIGQPHDVPDGMQCLIHYPDGSSAFQAIAGAFLWAQNGAIIEARGDDTWQIAVQIQARQWREVTLHRTGATELHPVKDLPVWPGGDGSSSQGFLQWLDHEVVWTDPNRVRIVQDEVLMLGVTDKDAWAAQNPQADGLVCISPTGVKGMMNAGSLAFEPRCLVDDAGRMAVGSRALNGLALFDIIPPPYNMPVLHPPAQPVTPIAPLPRKLWMGYFKTMGRSGDLTQQAIDLGTNLQFPSLGECDTSLTYEQKLAQFTKAAEEVVAANGALMGGTTRADIELFKPYWHRVCGVWIATNHQRASEVEDEVRAYEALLDEYGLPRRPVYWYVDGPITKDAYRHPAGVDVQALNLYLGPTAPFYSNTAISDLRALYDAQASLVPLMVDIALVAQAYDRNGVWKNDAALKDIQPVYADFARSDDRVNGIWWFSYGRTGGTLDHPELLEWHREILKANPGAPDISDPVAPPEPPTPPEPPMQDYHEEYVYQTNEKVKALYEKAGREVDAQYPVWVARTQRDYDAGMSWAESEEKHLAECREALGI